MVKVSVPSPVILAPIAFKNSKIHHLWLLGSINNGCRTLSKRRGHHNIGGTCHGNKRKGHLRLSALGAQTHAHSPPPVSLWHLSARGPSNVNRWDAFQWRILPAWTRWLPHAWQAEGPRPAQRPASYAPNHRAHRFPHSQKFQRQTVTIGTRLNRGHVQIKQCIKRCALVVMSAR